ncbi:MAG: hypothetical protein K6F50_08645 [Kiritimatiellae bacterium]|nr:hypothetical protein [Kiritimatiellia bacterium]
MSNGINLGNLNISISEFQKVSSGRYNAGEIALKDGNSLAKINNHVTLTGRNSVSLSHSEVLAIKEAFVKSLAESGVAGGELENIRRQIGLSSEGARDKSLKERSIKPLSRQMVREILDRNADAINLATGGHTVKTSSELKAGVSSAKVKDLEAVRNAVNGSLDASRATAANKSLSLAMSVLTDTVAVETAEDRKNAIAIAKAMLADVEDGSGGGSPESRTVTFRSGRGNSVTISTGMDRAAFAARLRDIIFRLENTAPEFKGALPPATAGDAGALEADAAKVAAGEKGFLDGEMARQALDAGYCRHELPLLAKTFALVKTACGWGDDAAFIAALNPKSDARALAACGGRFTASAANFREGLRLMKSFEGWYENVAANIKMNAARTATEINGSSGAFMKGQHRGLARFVFGALAHDMTADLSSTDPEKLFSMERNAATRFVGRGYATSAGSTMAQLPQNVRDLVYRVFDLIDPLPAEDGAKGARIQKNKMVIARVLKNADALLALREDGRLDRKAVLETLFGDAGVDESMSAKEIGEKLGEASTGKFTQAMMDGGDKNAGVAALLMMENGGGTYEECAGKVARGEPLVFAPRMASFSPPVGDMDGSAEPGLNAMKVDMARPALFKNKDGSLAIPRESCRFRFVFPDKTELVAVPGLADNPAVAESSRKIVDKLREFCGEAHPDQLSALGYAMSQSAMPPATIALMAHGFTAGDHSPVTYTLSRDDATGSITVRYSEPEGFPLKFSWTTTIDVNGNSVTTPVVVEKESAADGGKDASVEGYARLAGVEGRPFEPKDAVSGSSPIVPLLKERIEQFAGAPANATAEEKTAAFARKLKEMVKLKTAVNIAGELNGNGMDVNAEHRLFSRDLKGKNRVAMDDGTVIDGDDYKTAADKLAKFLTRNPSATHASLPEEQKRKIYVLMSIMTQATVVDMLNAAAETFDVSGRDRLPFAVLASSGLRGDFRLSMDDKGNVSVGMKIDQKNLNMVAGLDIASGMLKPTSGVKVEFEIKIPAENLAGMANADWSAIDANAINDINNDPEHFEHPHKSAFDKIPEAARFKGEVVYSAHYRFDE